MKSDNLALRTATTFVNLYAHEDEVMTDYGQAMDCRDCEAFLQLGIDAFNWVIRADQIARQAMFEGTADFDHDAAEDGICALCRLWLKSCDRAEKWIALQLSRNLNVDNLDRFRECYAQMHAIVKVQDAADEEMPEVIAELRDRAIKEHRNGETAEFV